MIHYGRTATVWQTLSLLIIPTCLTNTAAPANANSNRIYEFIVNSVSSTDNFTLNAEVSPGDVLATLELSMLPATHEEITSLVFTPAGEAVFGLGRTYSSIFTETGIDAQVTGLPLTFEDDGIDGLAGNPSIGVGLLSDTSPPNSTLIDFPNPPARLNLFAGEPAFGDQILLGTTDEARNIVAVFANGDWRLVPEPSTIALASSVLGIFCLRIRQTNRRHS